MQWSERKVLDSFVQLARFSKHTKSDVENLAQDTLHNLATSSTPLPYHNAFKACALQLPHASPIYPLFLANLLLTDPPTATGFVAALSADPLLLNPLKILTRFHTHLLTLKILPLSTLLTAVLNPFVQILQDHTQPAERRDCFAYLAMTSISVGAAELWKQSEAITDGRGIHTVWEALVAYMDNREPSNLTAAQLYKTPAPDPLTELYNCLLESESKGWPASTILINPATLFDLDEPISIALPPLTIPADTPSTTYPFQTPFLHLFRGKSPIPIVEGSIKFLAPPLNSLDRFVVSDIVRDLVCLFSHNRIECANHVSLLKGMFGSVDWIWEVVIETIFGELFRLPHAAEKGIYWGALIGELCKVVPDGVPSAVGRCVKLLFDQCEEMDVGAVRRFSEWFSVHLSNFGYFWKWADWEYVLTLPTTSTKYTLLQSIITQTIRLSYHDHIKNLLPQTYTTTIFPPPAGMNYAFDQADPEVKGLIEEFERALVRGDFGDTERVLEMVCGAASFNGMSQEEIKIQVVVNCVMKKGGKSFSHLLNAFERNLKLLQKHLSTPSLIPLNAISTFWSTNPQFLEITIDKLINYRVLPPKTVIEWVFGQISVDGVENNWSIWGILEGVLKKCSLRVDVVKTRLEKLRKESSGDGMEVENEGLEKLEDALGKAQRDQKDCFLFVCQKFIDTIHAKIQECEGSGVDILTTTWWRWVSGFMRDILRSFEKEVKTFKVTLEMLVFIDSVDPRILEIWKEVLVVYEKRIRAY